MELTLLDQLKIASEENIRLKRNATDEIRKKLFGVFGEGSSFSESFQLTTSIIIIEKAIEGKILGHPYVSVFHNDYPEYELPVALKEALKEVLGAKKIDIEDNIINSVVAIHF